MTELAYADHGSGDPVVFIAGFGVDGRSWQLYQTPAFLEAGYRAITFDNRGVGVTQDAGDFTAQTMVADTAQLISNLNVGPVRIVATSMGAYIAQELMLAHPELVSQAALLATRGRLDTTRQFFHEADGDLIQSMASLPRRYLAKIRLLENFSAKTMNDPELVGNWIDMFTMWPLQVTPGMLCQFDILPHTNRLSAYTGIKHQVLVIGFKEDTIAPPHLGAEVARAIPNGCYVEIADTGHLGFLEQPQLVNTAILAFFAEGPEAA